MASTSSVLIAALQQLQVFKFQKLFEKMPKHLDLLKERSKDADVNEGNFVLNIDVLFAL
jgi:hypothetical protein